MTVFDVAWFFLLAPPVLWEAWTALNHHDDDTLSERTRHWWKVSTPAGRAVFAGVWCGFAGWFLVHILF